MAICLRLPRDNLRSEGSGVGTTAAWIFGVINVIQFVNWWIEKRVRSTYDKNVIAAKDSLVAMRTMCNDAIEKAEILNTDSAKHFARQVAYMALTIENTLGAIIPDKKKA